MAVGFCEFTCSVVDVCVRHWHGSWRKCYYGESARRLICWLIWTTAQLATRRIQRHGNTPLTSWLCSPVDILPILINLAVESVWW